MSGTFFGVNPYYIASAYTACVLYFTGPHYYAKIPKIDFYPARINAPVHTGPESVVLTKGQPSKTETTDDDFIEVSTTTTTQYVNFEQGDIVYIIDPAPYELTSDPTDAAPAADANQENENDSRDTLPLAHTFKILGRAIYKLYVLAYLLVTKSIWGNLKLYFNACYQEVEDTILAILRDTGVISEDTVYQLSSRLVSALIGTVWKCVRIRFGVIPSVFIAYFLLKKVVIVRRGVNWVLQRCENLSDTVEPKPPGLMRLFRQFLKSVVDYGNQVVVWVTKTCTQSKFQCYRALKWVQRTWSQSYFRWYEIIILLVLLNCSYQKLFGKVDKLEENERSQALWPKPNCDNTFLFTVFLIALGLRRVAATLFWILIGSGTSFISYALTKLRVVGYDSDNKENINTSSPASEEIMNKGEGLRASHPSLNDSSASEENIKESQSLPSEHIHTSNIGEPKESMEDISKQTTKEDTSESASPASKSIQQSKKQTNESEEPLSTPVPENIGLELNEIVSVMSEQTTEASMSEGKIPFPEVSQRPTQKSVQLKNSFRPMPENSLPVAAQNVDVVPEQTAETNISEGELSTLENNQGAEQMPTKVEGPLSIPALQDSSPEVEQEEEKTHHLPSESASESNTAEPKGESSESTDYSSEQNLSSDLEISSPMSQSSGEKKGKGDTIYSSGRNESPKSEETQESENPTPAPTPSSAEPESTGKTDGRENPALVPTPSSEKSEPEKKTQEKGGPPPTPTSSSETPKPETELTLAGNNSETVPSASTAKNMELFDEKAETPPTPDPLKSITMMDAVNASNKKEKERIKDARPIIEKMERLRPGPPNKWR